MYPQNIMATLAKLILISFVLAKSIEYTLKYFGYEI